jgi:hypothetical protein
LKNCGRQFVLEFEQRLVSEENRALIQRILTEGLLLLGICRVVVVGMKWLMGAIVDFYETVPEHLYMQMPPCPDNVLLYRLKDEADELKNFVGKKRTSNGSGLRSMDIRARPWHYKLAVIVKKVHAVVEQAPGRVSPDYYFLDRWSSRLSRHCSYESALRGN